MAFVFNIIYLIISVYNLIFNNWLSQTGKDRLWHIPGPNPTGEVKEGFPEKEIAGLRSTIGWRRYWAPSKVQLQGFES